MGVVPIYTFQRHLRRVPDFHCENPVTCHLTFAVEIRHHFALGDTDYDSHIEKGRAYIYAYIMHNTSTQSRKVNAYIPRAWPKYRCRKVNRGHHTLEMRTNGTWHDIPNTTYPKREREEEGRGFKRVQNQIGKARPLNLLNTAAWLILT